MPEDELAPIGIFARRSGLTASALRFYADCGVLVPAEVDPVTGYRYYGAEQLARAEMLRRLREIGMPLAAVERVLAADAAEAVRLVDAHVAGVVADAAQVQRTAAEVRAVLRPEPEVFAGAVRGPVLAAAIEQILTATAHDPALPVLNGILVTACADAVTLTATDRYRLATRTLAPVEAPDRPWTGVADGGDLRAAVPGIRRTPLVRLAATTGTLRPGPEGPACRLLPGDFPDIDALHAALAPVGTRVTTARDPLLRALEDHRGGDIRLRTDRDRLHVGDRALPATTTGPDLTLHFDLAILHPAVSTAIGPDVLLDLHGPDQPVTLRSADRGDLTTLAMPVRPRDASASG